MVVTERESQKTEFCKPFGLFEFDCMPFGLCDAPGTFQCLTECIFGKEHFQSLLLYLDEMTVFSTSFDQHLTCL